jgi:hypothetical protein
MFTRLVPAFARERACGFHSLGIAFLYSFGDNSLQSFHFMGLHAHFDAS